MHHFHIICKRETSIFFIWPNHLKTQRVWIPPFTVSPSLLPKQINPPTTLLPRPILGGSWKWCGRGIDLFLSTIMVDIPLSVLEVPYRTKFRRIKFCHLAEISPFLSENVFKSIVCKDFVVQNFRQTKLFVRQKFRQQAKISPLMSGESHGAVPIHFSLPKID